MEAKVVYAPRECNKVADSLAKHGLNLVELAEWLWPDIIPEFVLAWAADGLVSIQS